MWKLLKVTLLERLRRINLQEMREWINSLSALGVLMLGIVVGYYAYKQWKATEGALDLTRVSIEDARRSFELSQRARLAVTGVSPGRFERDAVYFGMMDIVNSGEMPAGNVTTLAISLVMPANQPIPFSPPYDRLRADTGSLDRIRIAPKDTVQRAVEIGRLSGDTLRDLKSRKKNLYIFLRVQYEDGFGKERYMTCCVLWDPALGDWNACSGYNDGD